MAAHVANKRRVVAQCLGLRVLTYNVYLIVAYPYLAAFASLACGYSSCETQVKR
jgi:hypothetical protein